ncbi:MAG TPA: signal recognition particle protein [Desulfohalobiaceae bacterium]|nr:signal recognition particle protein [Desulfohalobiaceae bacterium]
MFESLSERLDGIFKKIKGHGRLDENTVQEGLREVRLALLEADVNYKVVKDFVDRIRERALGQDVLASLTPGQQVIKIVHEELVHLFGDQHEGLELKGKQPAIIMLVGLQGSGKTTTAAKLAFYLRQQFKYNAYLVSADVYRPAAIDQLQTLAAELDVPAYPSTSEMNPVSICLESIQEAREKLSDVVILDTAGRLHIDEQLMDELAQIKASCQPHEILLVADSMTGQDAVNVAQRFNEVLDLTGVVLTKLEGDARGGAALSIRSMTDKPIKFVGVGEKIKDLEPFHPDRVTSRILGMGDMLTLIEKAQKEFDDQESEALEKKLHKADFDLEDFRAQMRKIRKLGSIDSLMKLIPGFGKFRDQLKDVQLPEKELTKVEAIINSMTFKERHQPKTINNSRKERIAKGSGTTLQDINQLLKQFTQMQKMLKKMTNQGNKGLEEYSGMPGMESLGMTGNPGSNPGSSSKKKKERKKNKMKAKQRKKNKK